MLTVVAVSKVVVNVGNILACVRADENEADIGSLGQSRGGGKVKVVEGGAHNGGGVRGLDEVGNGRDGVDEVCCGFYFSTIPNVKSAIKPRLTVVG